MGSYGLDILANVLDSASQSAPVIAKSFDDAAERKRKALLEAQEEERAKTRAGLQNQLTQQQIDEGKTKVADADLVKKHNDELDKLLGRYNEAQGKGDTAKSLDKIDLGNVQPSVPAGAQTSLLTGETTAGDNGYQSELATREMYPELVKSHALKAGAGVAQGENDLSEGRSVLGKTRAGLFTDLGGLKYADNPRGEAIIKTLSAQDKADQEKEIEMAKIASKKNGQDTLVEAKNWKDTFLNDPTSRAMVQLYATGHMSEAEAMAKVPGFNKQSGPARLALTQAAIELNPPQYDDTGKQIGGFDPKGFSLGRTAETSHARKSGSLSPDIIQKEGEKAGVVAGASERARLAPDIVSGKVEKSARTQTAAVLDKQIMAAQRAVSTFDDALDKAGDYQNIPGWMYRDLASDYAKVLQSTGQLAEGAVDKVMQKSLKGDIVGAWNYATGDTKTTAPQDVLRLMHDRIKALNTDLQKQYWNQAKGTNLPINSDESTNPLRPGASAPVSQYPGAPPVGTKKGGYTFKGGNPNDKNNWVQ